MYYDVLCISLCIMVWGTETAKCLIVRKAPAERRLRQSDRGRSSEHEVNYTAALLPRLHDPSDTKLQVLRRCIHCISRKQICFFWGMVQVCLQSWWTMVNHGEPWWTMVNPLIKSADSVSPLEAPTPLWGSRPREEASWRRQAGDPAASHDLFWDQPW